MSASVSNGRSTPGSFDPIEEAGRILIRLAIDDALKRSSESPQTPDIRSELQRARELLSQAKPRNSEETHRYLAAKTALEALEATEREEAPLLYGDQFRGHVEAVRGGEGAEIFGGRRVSNKPSADIAFLRAAMFVLWERYEGDDDARAQLVKDAVSKGIIGSKTDSQTKNMHAVKTRVANIKNRPHDGHGPVAPEWEHVDLVVRLVREAGYQSLSDFQ